MNYVCMLHIICILYFQKGVQLTKAHEQLLKDNIEQQPEQFMKSTHDLEKMTISMDGIKLLFLTYRVSPLEQTIKNLKIKILTIMIKN